MTLKVNGLLPHTLFACLPRALQGKSVLNKSKACER